MKNVLTILELLFIITTFPSPFITQAKFMHSDSKAKYSFHNIIICLAGPYGAGCSSLAKDLLGIVSDQPNCHAELIRISDTLTEIAQVLSSQNPEFKISKTANPHERRSVLQKVGTFLRNLDRDFIGKSVTYEIAKLRSNYYVANKPSGIITFVTIVDSIKNVHDLNYLKTVYGSEVFFIFVHSNAKARWQRMVQYKSWDKVNFKTFIEIDQIDSDEQSISPNVLDAGQQVRKLAFQADYFVVNHANREKLLQDGNRIINLLFGFGSDAPTEQERCLHFAFSAANSSYCLSRQVGASIFDANGNIISIGHNDVPRAGGGLYSTEDIHDQRCYKVGDKRCINLINKQERFTSLSQDICKLIENQRPDIYDDSIRKDIAAVIEQSDFRELTEFSRAVHAEMEAIISACRSGKSVIGATMYVTTQPCHNCIKHIICSGISKVVFCEPYPKSLGEELHSDAIDLDPVDDYANDKKVIFTQYQGVSPKRYHDFFHRIEEIKNLEGYLISKSKVECSNYPKFAKSLPHNFDIKIDQNDDPMILRELDALINYASTLKEIQPEKKEDEL